jgi:hypothetical protein
MLDALVAGTTDPVVLAGLAKGGFGPSCPRCAKRRDHGRGDRSDSTHWFAAAICVRYWRE